MSISIIRYATSTHLRIPECPRKIILRTYAAAAEAAAAAQPTSPSKKPRKATTPRKAKPKPERPPPDRNPLDRNSIDKHLETLASQDVSIAKDLEDRRPKGHPPVNNPKYEDDYIALKATLANAFNVRQLRHFAKERNLDTRPGLRKEDYLKNIIEQHWRWPSLAKFHQRRRDAENHQESFDIGRAQFIALCGKDGVNLFNATREQNAHITFNSFPSYVTLTVTATRADVKATRQHIHELEKNVVEDIVQLPADTPFEDLSHLSRVTGSYIEHHGSPGQIRIFGENATVSERTRRLATRATSQAQRRPSVLLAYSPASTTNNSPIPVSLFPHTYSMYPFRARHLPWTTPGGSVFRIHRVHEWIGKESTELVEETGGLAGDRGAVMKLDQTPEALEKILFPQSSELPARSSTVITATFGHIVFNTPSHERSITPPLDSYWQFPKILSWMNQNTLERAFAPDLPSALLNYLPPQPRVLRRLMYHAIPAPSQPDPNVFKCEILLANPSTGQPTDIEEPHLNSLRHRCWSGSDSSIQLLLPDRPMDLQINSFTSTEVPHPEQPQLLLDYLIAVQNFTNTTPANVDQPQPQPPLTFTFRDLTYYLCESATVRHSVGAAHVAQNASAEPVQVIHENIQDAESSSNYTQWQVSYERPYSADEWKNFLHDCDTLTSTVIKSPNVNKWT